MESDSLFSLLLIFVMVLLGSYFSATETAFSALNRIRVKNIVDENSKKSKRAALVLRLHDEFDKLLSTLLVLNNVVTLVAASISTLLAIRYWGDMGATISTAMLTVIIVFFGDITPKSLSKESPEKVAMLSAPLLYLLVTLLSPVNYIFIQWKKFLGRIFNTTSDETMTEEELISYVEEAQTAEILNEDNRQLVTNAIEFKDLKAIDILTPRIDLVAISVDAAEEEFEQLFLESEFSRLVVYEESVDNIIGVVHMRDFFKYKSKRQMPMSSIYTQPMFVAPSTKLPDLFNFLQKQKSHLAVVTDEYGGTAGIITIEDILEELVGDIWDESDEIIVEFAELGENRYKVICSAYLKDLFAFFDLSIDEDAESTSVSGWIMDKLGKVPEEGDTFLYENLTVIVHKTQHRRVLECIITVNDTTETTEPPE
ncbi:MAG: hemolysin family protein [Turicibacter sp.]|nr:hemolysin family protein [Turicibacter sp.]